MTDPNGAAIFMVCHGSHQYMGVSENVVYPIVPNGFADHYPVFKWLFHWEYTLFSDKPIYPIDVSIYGAAAGSIMGS